MHMIVVLSLMSFPQIGSRRVIQWAALIMVLQGVINKFGAIFIMIPDPVVGGLFCVMFGMITAFGGYWLGRGIRSLDIQPEEIYMGYKYYMLILVLFASLAGLSALQYVDLRSSRNLYIIGLSIFFPLVLCQWMQKNPGAIDTGIKELDGTLSVLLGTTILVGGFLGCFLDHVIPGMDRTKWEVLQQIDFFLILFAIGTREERGLIAWAKEMELTGADMGTGDVEKPSTYDFPYGMNILRRWDTFIFCARTN